MPKILQGPRPDITAAQIAAVLVAGVPAIATLLTAFGLGDLSTAQQDALSGALTWSAILAGLLIGGDATLRAARNLAVAKTDAAAMTAGERLSPTTVSRTPPSTSRRRKRRRSPTRRSSTPTASCRRSRPECPSRTPTMWGVTRDEHRLRWDRADQGVRGLPVRRPPVLRQARRRVDDRLRPHRGRRAAQPAPDRAAGERVARARPREALRGLRRGAPDRASAQPEPVRRARRVRLQRRRRRALRRHRDRQGAARAPVAPGRRRDAALEPGAGDRPGGRGADAPPQGGAQALPHAVDGAPASRC